MRYRYFGQPEKPNKKVEVTIMLRKLTLVYCGVIFSLLMPAMAQAKTYYWISHGSPAPGLDLFPGRSQAVGR
jgi:hypothetical protein